jgi:phage tail-like protein
MDDGMSSVSERSDPLRGFNFEISLLDSGSSLAKSVTTVTLSSVIESPVGGFSECSGLEMSLDVEDYQEGGNNGTVLKFPTRVKWGNITLKKGLCSDRELWEWHYGFVEGKGKRRDGLIVLKDERRNPHTVWGFRRGLPIRYTGPALNASESSVAIESIEIAHEGLYQMPGISALTSAVKEVVGLFG